MPGFRKERKPWFGLGLEKLERRELLTASAMTEPPCAVADVAAEPTSAIVESENELTDTTELVKGQTLIFFDSAAPDLAVQPAHQVLLYSEIETGSATGDFGPTWTTPDLQTGTDNSNIDLLDGFVGGVNGQVTDAVVVKLVKGMEQFQVDDTSDVSNNPSPVRDDPVGKDFQVDQTGCPTRDDGPT